MIFYLFYLFSYFFAEVNSLLYVGCLPIYSFIISCQFCFFILFYLFIYLGFCFKGVGCGVKVSSEGTDKSSQYTHIMNGMLVFTMRLYSSSADISVEKVIFKRF